MMAQDEVEKREKRQKEGIKLALEKGVKFGRKKTEYPKEWTSVIKLVENRTINNNTLDNIGRSCQDLLHTKTDLFIYSLNNIQR